MSGTNDAPPVPSLTPITSNGSTNSGSNSDRAGGVLFAKRKKHTFKGPMLNSVAFFGLGSAGEGGKSSPGNKSLTPSFMPRDREGSDGKLNLGIRDMARKASGKVSSRRKSQIIEEEEEDEKRHSNILEEDEEEDIEEVDAFSPVEADLERGETIHSVNIWDDPVELPGDRPPSILIPPGAGDGILEEGEDDDEEDLMVSPGQEVPPAPLPKDDHDRPPSRPPSRPTTRGTDGTGNVSSMPGSTNGHAQELKIPKSRLKESEIDSLETKLPRNAFQRAASYARKKRDGSGASTAGNANWAPPTPPKETVV
jgi:hypothetical protein